MPITPDQIFAYSAAAVAAFAAGIERWRASKVSQKTALEKEVVSDAKRQEERATLMAKMADDYKILLEKEYAAHEATRDFHHKKAKEDQATLLKCNERVQELQVKTDLSKIETLLLAQGQCLQTMAEGIRDLLKNKNEHERNP